MWISTKEIQGHHSTLFHSSGRLTITNQAKVKINSKSKKTYSTFIIGGTRLKQKILASNFLNSVDLMW